MPKVFNLRERRDVTIVEPPRNLPDHEFKQARTRVAESDVTIISYGALPRSIENRFQRFVTYADVWIAANLYHGDADMPSDAKHVLDSVRKGSLSVRGQHRGWANSGLNPDVRDAFFICDKLRASTDGIARMVGDMLGRGGEPPTREVPVCIAVCCTWGKHRSVAMAERLRQRLEAEACV